MTEKATVLGWVTFWERDIVLIVAVFAELLGSFLAVGLNELMVLAMIVIKRDATGRFGWGLPQKSQDHDSNPDQKKIAFFKSKSHKDLKRSCSVNLESAKSAVNPATGKIASLAAHCNLRQTVCLACREQFTKD